MDWLSALLGIKKKPEAKPVLSHTAPQRTSPIYLTETVVFGRGDSSVYFVDENRGIRKMLVDTGGNIRNFPGILKEDFWVKEVSAKALLPKIRFRTSFEKRENKWIMLWTIQPDGDYWRDDDGFGAENEDEVVLYTYVDLNGEFTGPFRIYEVGERCYSLDRFEHAHVNRYHSALQALKAGKLENNVDVLFPRFYGMDIRVGFNRVWEYYTLCNKARAVAYWAHPVLSEHLVEAAEALLQLEDPITEIVGYPERRIVQACMTLFYSVSNEPVFKEVLDKFFEGKLDEFTLKGISV